MCGIFSKEVLSKHG
ncbi:DUF2627 domain-containing protein [Escherichia coli]|nr:DUF2627 domain-containing protein [Escherichia coli]